MLRLADAGTGMTLIVSCITRDMAVQVSDRRVSVPSLGQVDDQANKAIFSCGQSAWAYTGLVNRPGLHRGSGVPRVRWSRDLGVMLPGLVGREPRTRRV